MHTVELIENAFVGGGECQDINFFLAKLISSIHAGGGERRT
jgi:hypothetical protein